MTNIFISYRWDDSAGEAGRIYDRLKAHFGADRVFMDVTGIEFGDDINEVPEKVKQYRILLPVIGKTWASVTDSAGKKRLEDNNDQVRLEIQTGLENGLLIIPVLVDNARMPNPTDLPKDISELSNKRGAEVSHANFERDIDVLIKRIERIFEKEAEKERELIEQREHKISEIELALQKMIENKESIIVGWANVDCYSGEKLSVQTHLLFTDFNENLYKLVMQGWSVISEESRKIYSAWLKREWNKPFGNMREIAESIIKINEYRGQTLESIDIR